MIKTTQKRGKPSTEIGRDKGSFVGVNLDQDPQIGFGGKAGKMSTWKKGKKGGKR